jgi:hypothetical protein
VALILALSFLFLASPVLGYILVSSRLPLMTKLIVGGAGALILTILPIVVMLFAGNSG